MLCFYFRSVLIWATLSEEPSSQIVCDIFLTCLKKCIVLVNVSSYTCVTLKMQYNELEDICNLKKKNGLVISQNICGYASIRSSDGNDNKFILGVLADTPLTDSEHFAVKQTRQIVSVKCESTRPIKHTNSCQPSQCQWRTRQLLLPNTNPMWNIIAALLFLPYARLIGGDSRLFLMKCQPHVLPRNGGRLHSSLRHCHVFVG